MDNNFLKTYLLITQNGYLCQEIKLIFFFYQTYLITILFLYYSVCEKAKTHPLVVLVGRSGGSIYRSVLHKVPTGGGGPMKMRASIDP